MAASGQNNPMVEVRYECSARFQESLTTDERKLFETANVAQILLQEIKDADLQHKDGSVARKVSSAVLPFIAGIEQYGRALDVFANSNDVLCPLWGSIRVVLHLAREFGEYFDRIGAMLENLGNILHKLPRSLRLYPDNKNLQKSVIAIYKDLFEFASRAQNVFKIGKARSHGLKSFKNAVSFAASLRIVWKPFDVQFGDIKERISKNVTEVESEADIAEKELASQERIKDDDRWNRLEVTQRNLAEYINEQSVAKVNQWLSPVNIATNHKAATNLRHGETGSWFLRGQAFQDWINGSNTFLWLHAIPGAGKTVLASSIINYLRDNVQSKTDGLAYFYCDYKDVQKQEPSKVLGTILASLAKQNEQVFGVVQNFFLEQYKDTPTFTAEFDELLNHFGDFVNNHFRTGIIVVDALDETGPTNMVCLANAFRIIHQHCKQFKILITSRNELPISRAFEDLPRASIEQSDVAPDIKDFITADIAAKISQRKLKVRDHDLEVLIRDSLVDGSKGMFQWAKCQIEALCRLRNNKAIKAALLNLPKTLQDTYVRILQRVEEEYPEDIDTVCKILRWLVGGVRNLTLYELAEAIAVDPEGDETHMDFDAVDNDPEDILELLGGLVSVASDHTISLAHYSVKEFLISTDIKVAKPQFWIADGQVASQLASVCLTYLCYDDFKTPELPDAESMEQRLEKYKLFRYATEAWATHVHLREQNNGHDDRITDLTMHLFSLRDEKDNNFNSWVECHQYCKFSNSSRHHITEPLEVTAIFGLARAASILLTTTECARQSVIDALIVAAAYGHAGVVEACLNYLASNAEEVNNPQEMTNGDENTPRVDETDDQTNDNESRSASPKMSPVNELPKALYKAAAKGHLEVVSLLLDHGCPINARGGKDGTALQAAALEGRADVVKLLLDKGASHWEACKRYGTPLSAAAEKAHQRTFGVLLDFGANPNSRGGWHSLPLVAAIVGKNMNIIRRLVDAGADVNAIGGRHGGPLPAAAAFGMNDLVRELVDEGAKVNDEDDKASDALYAASLAGHISTVELLLELGADVNAKGGRHRNALGAASSEGHLKVVDILLDFGADETFFDEHWGNALQIAAQRGHVDVVKMLAEAGMDVNAKGADKGTALVGAAANGYADVIQNLFDLGVASGSTQEMTNALIAASSGGHYNVVELLLDNGADMESLGEYSQTSSYCTPLQAAASKGRVEVVKLLIQCGARLNDIDAAWFGTPLVAAATSNDHRKEMIMMMLAAGANVNEVAGSDCHYHGSALANVAQGRDIESARVLLDHGADINLQWSTFYSPLDVTISENDNDMFEFFLSRGADINNLSDAMDLRSSIEDGLTWGTVTPLQTAAWYGHEHLVRKLVELGADLSVVCDDAPFTSALQVAAYRGHVEIVKAIIDSGGDVNEYGGYFGSSLQAAACQGHLEVVRVLLNAGAAVNELNVGHYHSALLAACMNNNDDSPSIVKLLIESGVDVNQRQKGLYAYPLQAASMWFPIDDGDTEEGCNPLELLLDAGANPNACGGMFGTALQVAASRGQDETCTFLLERGADPNIAAGFYCTALQAAYRHGYYIVIGVLYRHGARNDIIGGSRAGSVLAQGIGSLPGLCDDDYSGGCCRTLIYHLMNSHGFDPNARYGIYGNPLQNMIVSGREMYEADILIRAGADINKVGGKYGTAITAAIVTDHSEARDSLLEQGADLSLGSAEYPNAAFGAIQVEDSKMLGKVLEQDINMKSSSTKFGTLAQHAARTGNLSILRQVVRAGAEINTPICGTYGSPLQAAAWSADEDMVRYLIHRGADVRTRGGRFGGVLNTAVIKCSNTLIEFLLEKGADANEPGRVYGTPLQAASICEPAIEIILVLLRYGADINRTGGRYATALQAACVGGFYDIVQLLIEKGADPNIVGGRYRTALYAAAIRGWDHIVQYLLDEAGATWSLVDRKHLGHISTQDLDEADKILQEAIDPSKDDEDEDDEDKIEGEEEEEEEEEESEEESDILLWNVESIPNACIPYQFPPHLDSDTDSKSYKTKWSIIREMSSHTLLQKYLQGTSTTTTMTMNMNGSRDPNNPNNPGTINSTEMSTSSTPRPRRPRPSRASTSTKETPKRAETWDSSALDWVEVEADDI